MRRTKAEAEQTRLTILDSALQLFNKNGYNSTSLSQIAAAAGVTRGAIYWHFKDKAHILQSLCEIYLDPHIQAVREALTGENSWQKSREIIASSMAGFSSSGQIYLVHICHMPKEIISESSPLAKMMRHYSNLWREQIRLLIARAAENGEIPADTDRERAFQLISVAITGIIAQYSCHADANIERHAADIIRRIFDLIRRGG